MCRLKTTGYTKFAPITKRSLGGGLPCRTHTTALRCGSRCPRCDGVAVADGGPERPANCPKWAKRGGRLAPSDPTVGVGPCRVHPRSRLRPVAIVLDDCWQGGGGQILFWPQNKFTSGRAGVLYKILQCRSVFWFAEGNLVFESVAFKSRNTCPFGIFLGGTLVDLKRVGWNARSGGVGVPGCLSPDTCQWAQHLHIPLPLIHTYKAYLSGISRNGEYTRHYSIIEPPLPPLYGVGA